MRRKFLNPTLQHSLLLNSFQPVFNEYSKKLIEQMDSIVVDGEVDIYPIIEKLTLNLVCGKLLC